VKGQWIGKFEGGTGGTIIVNIDERESNFQGTAYLLENSAEQPSSVAYFRTPDKSRDFSFHTNGIQTIDPKYGNVQPWEAVKQMYPQCATFSTYADIHGSWNETSLSMS